MVDAKRFEATAQLAMSKHYGAALSEGQISGVPKKFDFVSSDRSIVGDAKFYSLVRGVFAPPAKYSVISEYVWLMQNCVASKSRFLVFGNDRRVPEGWLRRFGDLASGVKFFFLDSTGVVPDLN
jgi:hypothetical protein